MPGLSLAGETWSCALLIRKHYVPPLPTFVKVAWLNLLLVVVWIWEPLLSGAHTASCAGLLSLTLLLVGAAHWCHARGIDE